MKCEYFTDFIHAHVKKTDANRIYIDKLMTRKIVNELALPLPKIFFEISTIDDLVLDGMPDPIVIKLTNLAAKRGVFILYKVKGGYFEQLRSKLFSKEELVALIKKSFNPKTSRIIGEEVIKGLNGPMKIPFDYKLYTFDGSVKFILQIDRNNPIDNVAFFDGDFEPTNESLVKTNKKYVELGEHVKPSNYNEMISIAEKVSNHIDRPFISVDLYTTGDNAYVGELTPTPGGPYFGNIVSFSEEFDKYLGALMLDGYMKRRWEIPEIESLPPARKKRKPTR
ncbi:MULTISPECIES: ATP-grasp fold amidoligase family protein [unclassified Cobetia]|uniref:ATP-grasp fold amidoligase family protein n=1 Tax=unclassified Cobetia TaxID=2609414 RepID=UPI002096A983|nr:MULTISPECIES: ATP-grasp fold amidoligase family protein [unclassified Cobetia]MCO7233455.1 hypothetical protein [Cobetia sp. Dlab-2-AX]MCO7236730.1 hypothetical protein [Cobetia sp. Dlab-2-U]